MASKLLPITIPFKIKKKQVLLSNQKVVESRPFKKRWPKILEDMISYPERSTQKLWSRWAARLDDVFSHKQFVRLLNTHGMMPGKVKKESSPKAQVALAIQSFAEVKKDRADAFMTRISKKINEVHDVVDEIKVIPGNVGGVLDLVSRLHKEGRIAYGIDDENPLDKRTTNVAILIGYEPKPKKIQAQIVDV